MAHAALSRKLTLSRREEELTISVTSETYTLPSDFKQIIALSGPLGPMCNATANHIASDRLKTPSANTSGNYHVNSVSGAHVLQLAVSASVSAPVELTLIYRTEIPDFATTDASWLAEEYLDLYTYAVFKHSGPFLREDERVALWKSYYDEALFSALEEEAFSISYGGSPLKASHPTIAP
jgi:hypothetical protein